MNPIVNLDDSLMIDLSFNISEKIQSEEKANRDTLANDTKGAAIIHKCR